jgi:hypothetical protein
MNEAKYKRELTRVRQEAVSLLKVRSTKEKDLSEEDLKKLSIPRRNQEELGENFGCSQIIDYMKAYYEVRFKNSVMLVNSCIAVFAFITD